jgi:hypothetical protein
MLEQLVVPISKAAHLLGSVHRATIYRLAKRGQLELVPVGGRTMVTMKSIRQLAEGEVRP